MKYTVILGVNLLSYAHKNIIFLRQKNRRIKMLHDELNDKFND